MSTSPVRAADSDLAEEGGSQAVKAQQRLREWILAGELPSGTRIAELALVERLGMSRTPIRAALMHLKQEGLLEPLPHGGYAVRTFSEREVADAIELRGTLEGLAARLAAERIQVHGRGGDQRFTFAGLHFGDFPLTWLFYQAT